MIKEMIEDDLRKLFFQRELPIFDFQPSQLEYIKNINLGIGELISALNKIEARLEKMEKKEEAKRDIDISTSKN